MRLSIQRPGNKWPACTFTIALEAFRKSGRFKRDPKIAVKLCSISHATYGGNGDFAVGRLPDFATARRESAES